MSEQFDTRCSIEDPSLGPVCTCECGCKRVSFVEDIYDFVPEPMICMACLYGCMPW